ncbi:hypothetical protein SAMN05920897_11310 [Alkalispirochaeta americana]|uniref:Uncharacterized protein n=1 Tax=Alkalispirochaeta americana TaxID=159291 RepID=A0A1N6UT28_9SPIO|nr:hypothetical protein SAMN05920897_11310 [Alkalispirochaeta americana]
MTREMLSHFNLSTPPFSKEIATDDLLTLPSMDIPLNRGCGRFVYLRDKP